MSFTVMVNVNKAFKVNCTCDEAFDLLADVPRSASHFPKVDQLRSIGRNSYRWEMEKIGLDRYYIQTAYACHYTSNRKDHTVRWEPIEGEGNANVIGRWEIRRVNDTVSQCRILTSAEITVPLPALLRLFLSGLIENEFRMLIDGYVRNLKKALDLHHLPSTEVTTARAR